MTDVHYYQEGYVIKLGNRLPHKMLSGEVKHACRIVGDSRLIMFSPQAYKAFTHYKQGIASENDKLLLNVALDQVGIK